MTGDSKKKRVTVAVTLAAIMAVSMLALGIGFGSVAAVEDGTFQNDGDDALGAVANNSNTGNVATQHIFRVQTSEVGGDEVLHNVTIDYEESVLSGSGDLGNSDVNLWINNTEISNDGINWAANDGDNITIGTDSNPINASVDSNITEGEFITVQIDDTDANIDVDNPENVDNADVTVNAYSTDDADQNDISANDEGTWDLQLDQNAPIALDSDGDESTNLNTSIVNTSLEGLSAGDNITVRDTVNNTDPSDTGLFATTNALNEDEVTLEGDDAPTIVYDDQIDTELISIDAGTDHTEISGITFDALGNAETAITGENTGVYNLTIADNQFDNIDGIAVDIEADDGDDPVTVSVDDNEFNEVQEALAVNASGGNQGSSIEVTDNEVNLADASGDVAIDLVGAETYEEIALHNNDVTGDESDLAVNATDIAADGGSVDIQSTSDDTLSSVDTAVYIANASDVVEIDGLYVENATDGVITDDAAAIPDVEITDGVIGSEVGFDGIEETALRVDSNADWVNVTGTEINLDDGTTAIEINGSSDPTVQIDNVDVSDSGSATGIEFDDNAGGADLEVDQRGVGASNIDYVDVGIDVVHAADFNISDTELNVSSTGIDIQAVGPSTADGQVIHDITVEGVDGDETAVILNDNVDLNVSDSEFGTDDQPVDTGLDVSDLADDLHVTPETTSTDIHLDESATAGIKADEVTSGIGGEVRLDALHIFGDGDGIAVDVSDSDDGGDLFIGQNEHLDIPSVSIGGVQVGINASEGGEVAINSTEMETIGTKGINLNYTNSQATVENVILDDGWDADTVGIHVDEPGADVDLFNVTTEDFGTGVQVNDAGDDRYTINESSITTTESDQTGILVDALSGSADVVIAKNELTADDEDSTGVEVDDSSGDTILEFNDIEGFTGDGYGLAGDFDETDATANWWGDNFGPQSDDGSNVDVAADGQEANVYDPFLTADTSTLVDEIGEFDGVEDISEDHITQFAHDLEIGQLESIAFPGPSDRTIDELAADDVTGELYKWDAESQSWESADADERPDGMDAYVLALEDDNERVLMNIEFEADETRTSDVQYEEGWNLAPSASAGDLEDYNTTHRFNLPTHGSDTNYDVRNAFASGEQPNYGIYANTDMGVFSDSDLDTAGNTVDVSPFEAHFVYFADQHDTAQGSNSQGVDARVTLDEVLDQLTTEPAS